MINLKEFQLEAIDKLMDGMASDKREIILKSPTGSGKTIILTHFIRDYITYYPSVAFVWLTPKKGGLEEQSKDKVDKYVFGASTKLLPDVMTSGFEAGDVCFINWEKLTNKKNTALSDGEKTNFLEHIEKALDDGVEFKIIVDEAHYNDTIKADDIIAYFKTDKIIRCSATPKNYADVFWVEVDERKVIAEGLIKRLLAINPDFPNQIKLGDGDDGTTYLLDRALEKHRELRAELLNRDIDINPLIIVQIPNNDEILTNQVEQYFESKGITYDNNQLAIRVMQDGKRRFENFENDITEPNAEQVAAIIKQSVSTGWDCPRAYILVKLRHNMDETFEIQTVGRIRRMPEAKHYDDELLDTCYLYTFDEKFSEGVKNMLGGGALNTTTLRLKPEYRDFKIISETKSNVNNIHSGQLLLRVIHKYFEETYNITKNKNNNKGLLIPYGYEFGEELTRHFLTGSVVTVDKHINDLNKNELVRNANTHTHGREFVHAIGEISRKSTIDDRVLNPVLRRLFSDRVDSPCKILGLTVKEFYAFVINNMDKLKEDVKKAITGKLQEEMDFDKDNIYTKEISLPEEMKYGYNPREKTVQEYTKNVYAGYLSSASPRSEGEMMFEEYCQNNDKIKWFYKNGDKGDQYFSVVYKDAGGKQKLFYPDYILDTVSGLYVIETKGGFTRTGTSEDIDPYSHLKFDALERYLNEHGLKGGFVRRQGTKLYICTGNYSDDITSDDWKNLKELWK